MRRDILEELRGWRQRLAGRYPATDRLLESAIAEIERLRALEAKKADALPR